MFCPKCGSLLMPKKEEGKKIMACSCGFKDKNAETNKIKEVVEKNREVEVVDEANETLPKTEAECSKCGHNEAYFWMIQTRASDEPETRFFRCGKCKYTWREYS